MSIKKFYCVSEKSPAIGEGDSALSAFLNFCDKRQDKPEDYVGGMDQFHIFEGKRHKIELTLTPSVSLKEE